MLLVARKGMRNATFASVSPVDYSVTEKDETMVWSWLKLVAYAVRFVIKQEKSLA